jgi:predicted GNAT family N-acyltransferase
VGLGKLNCKLVSNDRELRAALKIRKQVFVNEQGVSPDLEFDGHDGDALHIVAIDGENIIGTARVIFITANKAKLERMAILKPFRKKGIGRGIITFVKEELRKRRFKHLDIHAQYSAVGFYESCGFKESGVPFYEADIKHVKMAASL